MLATPRHLLMTAAVFILAGGTIGGAIGFVGAQATDELGTFTFAEPMAGDQAVYSVEGSENRRYKSFGLTWHEDRQIILDGARAWYNTVGVDHIDRSGEERSQVYHILPGTHDAVASAGGRDETTTEDGESLTVRSNSLWLQPREGALPCGFVTPFQGKTIALESVRFPVTMCWLAENAMDHNGGYRVSAYGNETVEVTGYWYDEPEITFWYHTDIPYPIRIVEHGDRVVWTLDAFHRGDTPVRHMAEPGVPVEVPALQWRPTPDWGIDTTGVDMEVSAEDAWNAALDDPSYTTLEDYLATHPDAYMQDLYVGHYEDDRGQAWHYWTFDVSDGEEWISVHARRIDNEPTLVQQLTGESAGTWDFSDRGIEDAADYAHPPPEAVPDRLPTLASMLRVWDAYRGTDFADAPGNYVRAQWLCWDCEQAELIIEAGYAMYTRTFDGPTPGSDHTDHYESSTVQWRDLDGFMLYQYTEHTQDWYPEGDPPPGVEPMAIPTAVALSVGNWRMPTPEEAAWAGFGAALASLLYFLHPLAKTGAVGLFSRIRRHELLDHPQRRRLMDRIEAEPGVHHQALARELEIGKGATEHHLRKLHEGGLVKVHKSAGYTCYFPANTGRRDLAAAPVLKSGVAKQIVASVEAGPATAADVRRALGISPSTMHYHLKRLAEAGVLDVQKEGNGQRLMLAA